jgi:hypothetical protein
MIYMLYTSLLHLESTGSPKRHELARDSSLGRNPRETLGLSSVYGALARDFVGGSKRVRLFEIDFVSLIFELLVVGVRQDCSCIRLK